MFNPFKISASFNAHNQTITWKCCFSPRRDTVWLGANPNTMTEYFYRKSGWKEVGKLRDGEIKFVMTYEDWAQINENENTRPSIKEPTAGNRVFF